MHINANDTVLTLTSGGCNGLNLLLHGAGHVVSVDCNPAQSSLLELKATAIQQLEFEDVWQVRMQAASVNGHSSTVSMRYDRLPV